MNGGWFAMSRAMFEHPVFKGRADFVGLWAWMVGTAAWKPSRQDANGKTVIVNRGQLLTSYRQISKATGVPIRPIRTLIGRLQDEHAISIKTDTGRMLITICNYEKYQAKKDASDTGATQERHTKEQDNKITKDSVPYGTDAGASSAGVAAFSLQKTVWDIGKPYLSAHKVKNPGGIIGKWLSSSRSAVLVLEAIEAAQKSGTEDPVPYITEILKPKAEAERVDVLALVRARRAKGEL